MTFSTATKVAKSKLNYKFQVTNFCIETSENLNNIAELLPFV